MAQRVLVSGGAGFIGSNLVDALLEAGHEVWVFDRFTTGREQNLKAALLGYAAAGRFRVITGSVTRSTDVTRAMFEARPHIVYHLAARTDVAESVADPLRDLIVNVSGTAQMLKVAEAADVRRFVFASSAAIFGDAGVSTTLRMGPDGLGVAPISPYGAGKAAAMLYVDLYDRLGASGRAPMLTDTVIFSNVYGPRQAPGRGAVNIFARALLAGEPVTLYGDGGNTRDYLYVADAVRALMWAGGLLPPVDGRLDLGPAGPALVGTGVGTTDAGLLEMLAREVAEQTGRTGPEFDAVPMPGRTMPARPGDIRTSVFPASELATTKLADGLRLTVEALRKETGS